MEISSKVKKKTRKKQGTLSNRDTTNKRVAHNAVESRRKLKITQLVGQLSALVAPGCQCGKETKVDVLQKVVQKIKEVERKNDELKASIEDHHDKYKSEDEMRLQEQLAAVIVEHVSLLFSYLRHKNGEVEQKDNASHPPSTNERCGFGVADLLETYDRPTQPTATLNSSGRNVGLETLGSGADYCLGDAHKHFGQRLVNSTVTSDDHTHPACSTEPPQLMVPPTLYSTTHWQPCNHLQDSNNTWEQARSFPIPPNMAVSYYPEVETHPLPHPSQYLHDPNRTSAPNGVWRPYNDQQSQQACLSNQTNSSFLVEQLLEKLL